MTLEECIQLAVAHHGSLRIADRRILIAQDRVLEAWAVDLPKLTAQGRFDIREKETVASSAGSTAAAAAGTIQARSGSTVTGSNLSSSSTSSSSRRTSVDRDITSGSITAIVPIYNFGLGYHQRQAARYGVEVAEFTAARTEQDLILSVSQAYYRILEAQKIKWVVEESIKTVERQLAVARDFLSQGLVAKNDVLVVEVQLAQRHQELIQAENNIQLAIATLNRLMDQSVTRDTKVVDVLEVQPWKGSFDTVFRLAINNRPDLAALRRLVRIAEENYRTSRAGLAPQISIYGTWSFADVDKVKDKDSGVGGIIADWSVFDGGFTYAQMAERAKLINEAIDQQSEQEKDIILDVKRAYLNLNEAVEQIPVARKNVELAVENMRITRVQYDQGLMTSADVLLEEQRLSQARSSYYQALYKYHESYAVMVNAIGTSLPKE